jgi:hypothetical protein
MHLRRSLALGSGALLLTASLSACGFDLATDRVNNIANGATDRETSLDVLNAVVVSAEEGSGVMIATLVNNDVDEAATLEGLQPVETSGESGQASAFPDFAPVEVPPNGLVNLASDDQAVTVEGDFAPGDVISVGVQISGGQVIELDIPVVEACGDYAGIVDGAPAEAECEISEPVGEH